MFCTLLHLGRLFMVLKLLFYLLGNFSFPVSAPSYILFYLSGFFFFLVGVGRNGEKWGERKPRELIHCLTSHMSAVARLDQNWDEAEALMWAAGTQLPEHHLLSPWGGINRKLESEAGPRLLTHTIWPVYSMEISTSNFHLLVHSPEACNSQGWTRLKQEPGTPCILPSWMIETQVFAGSWMRSGGTRTISSTLMRDVGVLIGGLACCTMPAPSWHLNYEDKYLPLLLSSLTDTVSAVACFTYCFQICASRPILKNVSFGY